MAWDLTTPADNEAVSQGASRIRSAKSDLQTAFQADKNTFPGPNNATPVFYAGFLKDTTANRPAASTDYPGRLFWNTDTGTIQRVADNGLSWQDTMLNPATAAIHAAGEASIASIGGILTIDETSNSVAASGTEALTSITGWALGKGLVFIRWTQARTLTYSGNLLLLRGVSRPVLAGDVSLFQFIGVGQVREIMFSCLKTDQTLPTRQVFLSGSGTYTTPTGARQLRVRTVGGGGGGGASQVNNGAAGVATVFGGASAAGGSGGAHGTAALGGAGGTSGTSSSTTMYFPGGSGSVGNPNSGGGSGGGSMFGGGASGGYSAHGIDALANTGGGGGGGAGTVSFAGSGGGGGEGLEYIIITPAATYTYAVGTGGAGGLNTPTTQGGNGGSGLIIVDEYY